MNPSKHNTSKTINMNAFRSTMIKAWNPKGKFQTNILHQNAMAFILESPNDYQKILNLSWSFRDSQINIHPWPDDKALSDIDMSKIYLWIHIFNLPINLMNLQTATHIGNKLGLFLKADLGSSSHKWRKSMRVMIQFDFSKPLTDHVFIQRSNNEPLLVEIRYERVAEFCFACGLIGHKHVQCGKEKNKEKVEQPPTISLKFGPWLKLENSHIKNPFLAGFVKSHTPTPQPPSESASGFKNTLFNYLPTSHTTSTHVTTSDWDPTHPKTQPISQSETPKHQLFQATTIAALIGKDPSCHIPIVKSADPPTFDLAARQTST